MGPEVVVAIGAGKYRQGSVRSHRSQRGFTVQRNVKMRNLDQLRAAVPEEEPRVAQLRGKSLQRWLHCASEAHVRKSLCRGWQKSRAARTDPVPVRAERRQALQQPVANVR